MVRTPFFAFGVTVEVAGAAGAVVGSVTCRTALSAGVFARKSSSAPGKLALRVIGRLLWQLIHGQVDDKTERLRMMRHMQ